MNDDFRVCLRQKINTLSNQCIPKFCVIFDNAVMDKCHTITRKVGVSVQRRGLSVRRPAGMRNTTETRDGVLRIRILKRLHLACIFV